eukprot:g3010.t1
MLKEYIEKIPCLAVFLKPASWQRKWKTIKTDEEGNIVWETFRDFFLEMTYLERATSEEPTREGPSLTMTKDEAEEKTATTNDYDEPVVEQKTAEGAGNQEEKEEKQEEEVKEEEEEQDKEQEGVVETTLNEESKTEKGEKDTVLTLDDIKDMNSENALEKYADNFSQNGKYLQEIRYRERVLMIRKEKYGAMDDSVVASCAELVRLCNSHAMKCLNQKKYSTTHDLLQESMLLTSKEGILGLSEEEDTRTRLPLRALTLSNLGCLFKEKGELRISLKHLTAALKIELKNPYCDNPARSHLNLCAVLSQLGQHRRALRHGLCALELIDFDTRKEQDDNNGDEGKNDNEESGNASLKAITHYNIAVECEHCNDVNKAMQHYNEAYTCAKAAMGKDHPMTKGFQRSKDAFKEVYDRKKPRNHT